jgi:hypothetical protein
MSRLTQFCLALAQHLAGFTSTRLLALFFLALALTWTISRGDVTAEVLFQSPESPVPEPVPLEQEFVPEAPPVEAVIPEPPPVEEVVPVAPVEPEIPVEPPPVEEAVPVAPVEPEIPVEPQPELVQPQAEPENTFESPVGPLPATEQQAEAPVPAAPEPSSRRVDPEERRVDDELEEAGEANFILDRAEFIDTMVVSTAYVWLCCGIVIFLMIPLVFLFLQIRGRTKMSRENIY